MMLTIAKITISIILGLLGLFVLKVPTEVGFFRLCIGLILIVFSNDIGASCFKRRP